MKDLGFRPGFLAQLEQVSLLLRRIKPGRSAGVRRSPKKGSSVEFKDFRNYSRGDDLRRVDWNAYARLDRLFVKLFLEEQDASVHLLVDKSRSMSWGQPSKLAFCSRAAAALCYIALQNYDRAAVGYFSEALVDMHGPISGKSSWKKAWEFIGEHMTSVSEGSTSLARSVASFGERRPAPGISVVFSDLLAQDVEAGLKSLQALSQEVTLVHVMSADEIMPPIQGELRLFDSETAQVREVSVTPAVLRAYRGKLEQRTDALTRFCKSRGIAYLGADSAEPVEDLVLSGLRTAGLLR